VFRNGGKGRRNKKWTKSLKNRFARIRHIKKNDRHLLRRVRRRQKQHSSWKVMTGAEGGQGVPETAKK